MAPCHPPARPNRLISRQVSELMLARGRRWHAMVMQDQLAGIVFGTVLSTSIAHLPMRDGTAGAWFGVDDAGALGRPVNAMAIAQSLALPHTTVRRRAATLVAAELLTRQGAGYRVAPAFLTGGAIGRVSRDNAAHLATTLANLAAAGHAPAADALAAGVTAVPSAAVERALLGFALRVLETLTQMYGNVTDGTLVPAIVAANIRHVTTDPTLSRHYATDAAPPPDSERRPITLRALARETGLPFETVRRRAEALIAAGVVERRDAGVVVPTRMLVRAVHVDDNRRTVAHFEQMLERLVQAATGAPARPRDVA